MQTVEFTIPGMTYDGRVETVRRHLRNLRDVSKVDVSFVDELARAPLSVHALEPHLDSP